MYGEEAHEAGAVGAAKAKRWLDATTRVSVYWTYPSDASKNKLEYEWADGTRFVFDLGGVFNQGELKGQTFAAEVKNYTTVGHQPEMYREFLARSYRARITRPSAVDQLMWITWNPFNASTWSKLTTTEEVRARVLEMPEKALGVSTSEEAESVVDDSVCEAIADSLWLLVLSDRHEHLMLSKDDRAAVIAAQIQRSA